MLMAFLTARGLFGLAKGWWLLIVVAALAGIAWWLTAREEADDRHNQEIGAAVQREGDLRQTINRVEEANHAREDNRTRTVDQRNADCVQRSRTPENCL